MCLVVRVTYGVVVGMFSLPIQLKRVKGASPAFRTVQKVS